MNRYLRTEAGGFRLLLDCRHVQEVGEWHRDSRRSETAWRDQALPLASLGALLGSPQDRNAHYVVLDTGDAALPRVMLLVNDISSLVDLDDDDFQTPLENQQHGSGLYDAAHDKGSSDLLLRLHPQALARAILEQQSVDA